MKPTQFNLGQEVLRATEAWLAANQVGVPESIKKREPEISGPCIECHQETEDRHDNAWMCDGCAKQLNEEYERDCRLDSPTHKQGGR